MGLLWIRLGNEIKIYLQLRHNSNATGPAFGKRFKRDGVLGVCLNMNNGTLKFSLNGELMGVAY